MLALIAACGRNPQEHDHPTMDATASVTLSIPSCTYADTCTPWVVYPMECTRIEDCTFHFAEPVIPYSLLDLDGTSIPHRTPTVQDGWDNSTDLHAIFFFGSTCEHVRLQSAPHLHFTRMHSCLP
jgi:hypothetical protein